MIGIDRLERRGFVRRLPDPNDRRGVIIELTEQGLEVVDAAVVANSSAIKSSYRGSIPTRWFSSKRSCASC
jgi:DNA-binding MarR family transcriptional regulator